LSAASPLFQRAWHLQDVVEREGGERRFLHPQSGGALPPGQFPRRQPAGPEAGDADAGRRGP
jgi:hypothetical protein